MTSPRKMILWAICVTSLLLPATARAQYDLDCAVNYWYYYDLWLYHQPCRLYYTDYIPVASNAVTSGDIGIGYIDLADYPRGSALKCFNLEVVGDYNLTIETSYDDNFGGEQFEVDFDGVPIGFTSPNTGPWGVPYAGPGIGADIGDFTVHVCSGEHKLKFREITMGAHSPDDICRTGMGHVHLGVAFHYVQTGSGAVAPAPPAEISNPASVRDARTLTESAALLRVVPNPSAQRTWFYVHSTMADASSVRLTVYDIRGARVWSTTQAIGPHQTLPVQWDGRTDQGSLARNGVYFLRGVVGRTPVRAVIVRTIGGALDAGPLAIADPTGPASGAASGGSAPGRSMGRPALRPSSNMDDGGDGGGSSPPPPPDIEDHYRLIDPYVHMNPDSTYSMDSTAALTAGLTHTDTGLGKLEVDLLNTARSEAGDVVADLATELAKKFLEDWIWSHPDFDGLVMDRPGGQPCGSWRNLDPGPHYICGFQTPKATKAEVVAALQSQGFAAEASEANTPLAGEKYWKPVSTPGCPNGIKDQVAYVIGCNCSWNYVVNTNPEPDLVRGPQFQAYPYRFWISYAVWWHYRKFLNQLQTMPTGCCP